MEDDLFIARHIFRPMRDFYLGVKEIPVRGEIAGLTSVKANDATYILFGSPLARCMRGYLDQPLSDVLKDAVVWMLVQMLRDFGAGLYRHSASNSETIAKYVRLASNRGLDGEGLRKVDLAAVAAMLEQEKWRVFDPSAWTRTLDDEDDEDSDEDEDDLS